MMSHNYLIGGSLLSLLAISFGEFPAVATQYLVNPKIASTSILIAINRPILKLGSQGNNVSELQATLKLLGYFRGNVDGFYGETTASAVALFQQASGLNADGIVGTATWNRLFPSVPVTNRQGVIVNNRQNTASNSVSGFPVPSSLQKPVSSRDTRINVTPTSAPVRRNNQTIAPTNNVSATATQTDIVSLPILRQGMRGPAIIQLQGRLARLGFFTDAIDGVFGSATHTAVKAAQQQFNLEADGIVGTATWNALLR